MSATQDKTKGKIKETVGEATGDDSLAQEGKVDLIKGDLQEIAQKGFDLLGHALGSKKN